MKQRRLTVMVVILVLAMMTVAMPCAPAESYHQSLMLYPNRMIGYAAEDTAVYSAPTEFSARISVGRGFPVFVVGSAGQFYIVENAAGERGYALKRALVPTLPSGANPFSGGYDPGWNEVDCQILLPRGMTIRATPYANAATMTLAADTPCWIVPIFYATAHSGQPTDFYAVRNADNGAMAYFFAADLVAAGRIRTV